MKGEKIGVAETAAQLIDALGGTGSVIQIIGNVSPSRVGNWRVRGFPLWARPYIIQAAVMRGVMFDPTLVAPRRPARDADAV